MADDVLEIYQLPAEIAKAVAAAVKGAVVGADKGKGVGGFAGDFTMGMNLSRVTAMLEPAQKGIQQFVGAIQSAFGPFTQIADIASKFTEALDPALVQELSARFRDLNAVVGVALRPIVDVARDVVHTLGNVLLPVMKKLEPIVRELAETIGAELESTMNGMGVVLEDLMPIFNALKDVLVGGIGIIQDVMAGVKVLFGIGKELLSELFDSLGGGGEGMTAKEFMQGLREVIQSIIKHLIALLEIIFLMTGWGKRINDMLSELRDAIIQPIQEMVRSAIQPLRDAFNDLIGSDGGEGVEGLGGAVKDTGDMLKETAASIGLFAVRIMALLGWTKGVEAMMKAMKPKTAAQDESAGIAAAQNAAFKSIGDLHRGIYASMFAASNVGMKEKSPAEKTNDFLAGMHDQMASIVDQAKADREVIIAAINGVRDAVTTLTNLVPKPLNTDNLRGFAAGAGGGAANAILSMFRK